MPDDSITQSELLRYLKESIEATRDLRKAVEDLRREISETYVRKDVWVETRKSDADAGLALQHQVNTLVSLRDWAVKIVVGAVIVALLGLVLYTNGGPVQ